MLVAWPLDVSCKQQLFNYRATGRLLSCYGEAPAAAVVFVHCSTANLATRVAVATSSLHSSACCAATGAGRNTLQFIYAL
jgi:hypothetical protein